MLRRRARGERRRLRGCWGVVRIGVWHIWFLRTRARRKIAGYLPDPVALAGEEAFG
jgi:hypothetical protein